ncbi:NAD(P)-dependent oxidoreductase [Acidomonas methanolica]|uniref:3-hydroxyisobutyrate dehydrogenase n=1 Tax=Acidomonas methanolica NBRC 104435 TaxID=1231351 RepID=A0A023D7U7_ACIMT|nr:NAD(P)-dependent oxidoreductase [Acidomonas methanolica]MBU2655292.1 NAD(P)-dependent oxidoreductase [Acidomonas methanolica]TCS23785.1 hypothetical protein EDC31_1273 [Acidomonas methanolica]GAJ29871.1 3-hydroxyisobutyrate dehydrogenase [Acidomonas methanolica NBRC 104435]GBQ53347.1 oxidoreductase [Acidomonas methanolica]GEL00220.1 3-hydroxyisobutyrate dehydrogenase [Acidomonas methanolica NBRC 104435]
MKLGFVGLGAMGEAMATCLLRAGHELTVYNRTAAKADALVAAGAKRARTPAEATAGNELVFTMLFDDAAVQHASFGPDGIAEALGPDAVHVGCATVSLNQARRLRDGHAERGQHYASATVLGRPPAARAGQLFVVLAAADALRARILPALDAFGQKSFVVGDDPVQANLVKLCLNFMIFATIEQMAEVFTLGEKGGIAPATMFEVMSNSFYTAPVHRNYGKLMVEKAYDPPGGPMEIGLKDNGLFLEAGEDFRVPLPTASLLRDRFLQSYAAGEEGLDFVAIFERVRADAGLR